MPEKPSTSWQKVRGTCTQREGGGTTGEKKERERGRKQSALAQQVATRSVVRNYCFCCVYGRVMYCVYKWVCVCVRDSVCMSVYVLLCVCVSVDSQVIRFISSCTEKCTPNTAT